MVSSKMIILSLFIYKAVLVYNTALSDCSDNNCGDPLNETTEVFKVKHEVLLRSCSHVALGHLFRFSRSCLPILPTMEFNQSSKEKKNEITEEKSTYPFEFVLLPEDEVERPHRPTRFRRFPKTCNDTVRRLMHTSIHCWAWPDFLTCEFICTHGYAIREDNKVLSKTTRNCRENENYWKPKATFPICEPYIHCKTFLVSPGKLHCKQMNSNPVYCDISCLPYEEHDAIPKKRYECLNDKYAQSLPHCASVNTSVPLIERPKA